MYALKLGLLFFWAAWFSIVVLTNTFDALKAAGYVPPTWRFASKNYEMVAKAVSIYGARPWVSRFLFLGVIAWQLLAAILFWYALAASGGNGVIAVGVADAAFATAIFLWGAFMLADEITIKYAMEQPHELLFIAQLASLLAVHLL